MFGLNFLKNWVKSLDAKIIDIENKMWNTVPNHYHCKICETVLDADIYYFQPKEARICKSCIVEKGKEAIRKEIDLKGRKVK